MSKEETLAAADHWERLAAAEDDMAEWDAAHGYGDQSAKRNKAKSYRRTAKSLRLEAETGKPHCTVCLGAHPNHECPRARGKK
jgi:hypothetical protein